MKYNKLGAILYAILLVFATIARFLECTFEAMMESRCVSLSFFLEVFSHNWNDTRYYTPIRQHWENIKETWNG